MGGILKRVLEILYSKDALFYLFLLNIFLALLVCSNIYKRRKLEKRYARFMRRLGNGNNFEEMLKNYMMKIDGVAQESREVKNYCSQLERTVLKCIQKVGVIRYNAFADMGSDLSFAIALLDANENGCVINGIYSRDGSSTYAKPIVNGKSKYMLSAEELQVLDMAKNGTVHQYVLAPGRAASD